MKKSKGRRFFSRNDFTAPRPVIVCSELPDGDNRTKTDMGPGAHLLSQVEKIPPHQVQTYIQDIHAMSNKLINDDPIKNTNFNLETMTLPLV